MIYPVLRTWHQNMARLDCPKRTARGKYIRRLAQDVPTRVMLKADKRHVNDYILLTSM